LSESLQLRALPIFYYTYEQYYCIKNYNGDSCVQIYLLPMLGNDYVYHEKCFNFCLNSGIITRIIFKSDLNFWYCTTEKNWCRIFLMENALFFLVEMENALYQFIRWSRDGKWTHTQWILVKNTHNGVGKISLSWVWG